MITYIRIDPDMSGRHPMRTVERPWRTRDWIEVPRYLLRSVRACDGRCELYIKDDMLVGVGPEEETKC